MGVVSDVTIHPYAQQIAEKLSDELSSHAKACESCSAKYATGEFIISDMVKAAIHFDWVGFGLIPDDDGLPVEDWYTDMPRHFECECEENVTRANAEAIHSLFQDAEIETAAWNGYIAWDASQPRGEELLRKIKAWFSVGPVLDALFLHRIEKMRAIKNIEKEFILPDGLTALDVYRALPLTKRCSTCEHSAWLPDFDPTEGLERLGYAECADCFKIERFEDSPTNFICSDCKRRGVVTTINGVPFLRYDTAPCEIPPPQDECLHFIHEGWEPMHLPAPNGGLNVFYGGRLWLMSPRPVGVVRVYSGAEELYKRQTAVAETLTPWVSTIVLLANAAQMRNTINEVNELAGRLSDEERYAPDDISAELERQIDQYATDFDRQPSDGSPTWVGPNTGLRLADAIVQRLKAAKKAAGQMALKALPDVWSTPPVDKSWLVFEPGIDEMLCRTWRAELAHFVWSWSAVCYPDPNRRPSLPPWTRDLK